MQLARDLLHLVPLLVGQHRVGLGEQVEDRELLLGQVLADGPLLLLGELLRQRDEAAQDLVDVEAAGVVLGDQLLEPLDQVEPGRVAPRRRRRPARASWPARRSVSDRFRPANRAASASKSICVRSISGSASTPSAAARITYSSAPTERSSSSLDRVGDVPRCRAARSSERIVSARLRATPTTRAVRGGGRVGQDRLEQLPHRIASGSRYAAPRLVVDEQRLDRRVAQRDELEARRAARARRGRRRSARRSSTQLGDRLVELGDQLRLVLDRSSRPGRRPSPRRRSRAPSRGGGRRRRSRRSARSPSRGRRGSRGRSSASACGCASAGRGRSSSTPARRSPVIHIAQTNTSRNGSSGSLNRSSRSSVVHPLRGAA